MDIIENRYKMLLNQNVQVRLYLIFVLHLEFQDKHGTNGRDAIMYMV